VFRDPLIAYRSHIVSMIAATPRREERDDGSGSAQPQNDP
jgi:hypothetical protein